MVSAYEPELGPDARAQLGDTQFELLGLLVRQAVSAGIHNAAERTEKLARELRSEAGSTEIEL